MSYYLIVPKPIEYESISSFVLRLSTENKYDRCKWIFDDTGLVHSHHHAINHFYNCNSNHDSFKIFSANTHLDVKEIINMTFIPLFGEYNNSNNPVDITLNANIHRLQIKFCPACLREELYHRKIWDLHQYNLCHIHKCLLITRCTECKSSFFLKSCNTFKCYKCNTDFRFMETIVSNQILVAEEFIYNKANQLGIGNNYLYKSPFKIALFILTKLSTKLFASIGRLSFYKRDDLYNRSNALNEVFTAFNNFPHSFYTFLNLVYKKNVKSKKNNIEGLQRSFGGLYEDIEGKFRNHKHLNFIYEAFNSFIKNHWDGYIINPRGITDHYKSEKWINRHNAKDQLCMTIGKLDTLIEEGAFKTKIIRNDHILISQKSLINYLEMRKAIEKNNQKLKKYHLTESQINTLIKLNILKKGKVNNGFKKVEGDLLITFFENISNQSIKLNKTLSKHHLINFNQVVRKYSGTKNGLYGILKDILEQKVKMYITVTYVTNLNQLFFDLHEIDRRIANKISKTKKELSQEFGICQASLKYLIDKEFLNFIIVQGKIHVRNEDISLFKKNYILLRDLKEYLKSKSVNIHCSPLKNCLTSLGINHINKERRKSEPVIYNNKEIQSRMSEIIAKLNNS